MQDIHRLMYAFLFYFYQQSNKMGMAHHAAAAAAAASSLQFFYPGADPLGQPPPAHMGIPPYQLDPKTAGAIGKIISSHTKFFSLFSSFFLFYFSLSLLISTFQIYPDSFIPEWHSTPQSLRKGRKEKREKNTPLTQTPYKKNKFRIVLFLLRNFHSRWNRFNLKHSVPNLHCRAWDSTVL